MTRRCQIKAAGRVLIPLLSYLEQVLGFTVPVTALSCRQGQHSNSSKPAALAIDRRLPTRFPRGTATGASGTLPESPPRRFYVGIAGEDRAGAPETVSLISEDDSTTVDRVWIASAAEAERELDPSPGCLRGAIEPAFSLVVFEGGSVDNLRACTGSLGIASLYALAGGVWVPCFLGVSDFVNERFRGLFPYGLPPQTPLVAQSRS